ncbi:hypothetical protein [Amycolatopsis circi]|uniref:hypothetical protein n=1 Tax=Amycolatopsis circi TaxID=871959 RepID=UPI0013BE9A23|nr:hypothetical protein [Amycolatopsis circi]
MDQQLPWPGFPDHGTTCQLRQCVRFHRTLKQTRRSAPTFSVVQTCDAPTLPTTGTADAADSLTSRRLPTTENQDFAAAAIFGQTVPANPPRYANPFTLLPHAPPPVAERPIYWCAAGTIVRTPRRYYLTTR